MIESVVQFIRSKKKTGISFYKVEDEEHKPKKVLEEEEEDFDSDIDRRMNESLEQTDKKISLLMFYLSFSALLSIFCYQYGTTLFSSYSTVERVVLLAVSRLQDWSWILVPLVCGVSVGSFTWMIIYKDSRIPGIDPPTPLSPSKRTFASAPQPRGPILQMNYVFAITVGIFVFAQMLYYRLHPFRTPE